MLVLRLQAHEIESICTEVTSIFGSDAHVWLFGSRVYDAARGGDIDLYIEAEGDERSRQSKSRALRFALLTRLGDQRIDIVTAPPGGKGRSIDDVALREGVELTGASQ